MNRISVFTFLVAIAICKQVAHAAQPNFDSSSFKAIGPGSVQFGHSLSDSTIEVTTGNGAVVMHFPKGAGCDVAFKVRYDQSLAMTPKEVAKTKVGSLEAANVDRVNRNCLAMKETESDLSNFITYCEDVKGSRSMTLWQDYPVAAFELRPAAKVGELTKDYEKLRAEHWTGKAPPLNGEKDGPYVRAVDHTEAEKILKGSDSNAKTEILRKMENNLWTATPATREARLRLVELAMTDSDPKVQIEAISVLNKQRMTAGIPILKRMVDRSSQLSPEVRAELAESLKGMLSSAYYGYKETADIETRFGSDQPADIVSKAGGTIEAKHQKAFWKLCHRTKNKTDSAWKAEHISALRADLKRISTQGGVDSKTNASIAEGLRAYPEIWNSNSAPGESGSSPISR